MTKLKVGPMVSTLILAVFGELLISVVALLVEPADE